MPGRGGRRRELKSLGSTHLEMDPLLSAPPPGQKACLQSPTSRHLPLQPGPCLALTVSCSFRPTHIHPYPVLPSLWPQSPQFLWMPFELSQLQFGFCILRCQT